MSNKTTDRRWAYNTLPTMKGEGYLTDAEVIELILSDVRHGQLARSDVMSVVVDEAMIQRAAEAIARYWWETGGEWGNLPEPNDDDIACAKVGLRAALEVTEDE